MSKEVFLANQKQQVFFSKLRPIKFLKSTPLFCLEISEERHSVLFDIIKVFGCIELTPRNTSDSLSTN